jgi:hypothetical protein
VLGCFRTAAVRRAESEEGRLERRQVATAVEVPAQTMFDKRMEATPRSPTLRVGDGGMPPLLSKLSPTAPVGTSTLRLDEAGAAPDAALQATMEELQRQNEALRCVMAPRWMAGVVDCFKTIRKEQPHVTCRPECHVNKHVAF